LTHPLIPGYKFFSPLRLAMGTFVAGTPCPFFLSPTGTAKVAHIPFPLFSTLPPDADFSRPLLAHLKSGAPVPILQQRFFRLGVEISCPETPVVVERDGLPAVACSTADPVFLIVSAALHFFAPAPWRYFKTQRPVARVFPDSPPAPPPSPLARRTLVQSLCRPLWDAVDGLRNSFG